MRPRLDTDSTRTDSSASGATNSSASVSPAVAVATVRQVSPQQQVQKFGVAARWEKAA